MFRVSAASTNLDPWNGHGLTRFVAAVHSDTTSKFGDCSDRPVASISKKLIRPRGLGLIQVTDEQSSARQDLGRFLLYNSHPISLICLLHLSGVYCLRLLNGRRGLSVVPDMI